MAIKKGQTLFKNLSFYFSLSDSDYLITDTHIDYTTEKQYEQYTKIIKTD